MIARAQNAEFINYVVNHPSVRPHVFAPPGKAIDLTNIVTDPDHYVLTGEHGGMVVIQQVLGVFELHTQVLPEGRGKWAKEMALACMDYMFSRTNATEVFTRVPAGNVAAKTLTIACGARLEHTAWQEVHGQRVLVELYSGRIQDWIQIAPGLSDRGKQFHDMLARKRKALGLPPTSHPDDDWHDQHVGAAAGMILGGQPIKGVMIYNRWAAMALAPRINILSGNPLVIDIRDCKIKIQGDDFEILRDH